MLGTLNSLQWKAFADADDPLRAEPVDAGLDDVASTQEAAVMTAEACRGSRAQQIARLQRLLKIFARVSLTFIGIAALCMAAGRYL